MKNFKNLVLVALFFVTATMFAQTKITGTVVDETGEPLPGAGVVEKGTKNGTATDFDGKFILNAKSSTGAVVVSFVGFENKTVPFTGGDLGKIQLVSSNSLDEVVITASGVIDLAEDRKTPIAVTTLKAAEIQSRVGTSDLPELLKSTPSVQSVQRGGFGDGQMYLRGFDQTNTAFLLNGQPINGVEDGKMYWSNWTGVLDIANAVQVQRGLGSSKLAISSVGGTVNIVTKTVDKKEGGFVRAMVANDTYAKGSAYYSTGLMDNGFAISAMLGHWQGDGYMQGAFGKGQTYFLSLGYKPNEKHILNFLITGAPQWHGAAGGSSLKKYLEKGRRFSDWWGYINSGQTYSGGRNYYHKPITNLTWDWSINDNLSLSTVLYASFGRGGFAYPESDPRSSKRNKKIYDKDVRSFYSFRTKEGLLDYDAIRLNNIMDAKGTTNFVKASVNSHNWYGLVANLGYEVNENLNVNFGIDTRFYNGLHYRTVADLLASRGVKVSNKFSGKYTITEQTGFNPWRNTFKSVDRKQRFGYDYEENINYIGGFGQIEYATDNFSAFFQGAVSNQTHLKTDYWNYSDARESEKVSNLGYNLKAGGAFNLNENNVVFVNGGYYSRQPFHDDLYTNIRKSNELNKFGNKNQNIIGLEAGYRFKSEKFSANLNLYRTTWDNRILSSAKDTDKDGVSDVFTQSSGVKQNHMGAELEIFTRPLDNLKVNGFFSIGDWKYEGNVETRSYDENDNLLSQGDIAYVDGVKVGNAAQLTAGLTLDYTVIENLSFDATLNYNDKLFTEIDLSAKEYEKANNRGAIELPSYETLDLGVSYKAVINNKRNVRFRLNVNNVFDKFYIENSKTNKFAEPGDKTWKGINTDNNVYIGFGTTFNFGITYNF